MKHAPPKGLGKLRYFGFLLKPYWKYGKGYVIVTFAMAGLLQPFSAWLGIVLPQRAIDLVTAHAGRGKILLTIGLYTLGIALVAAITKAVEFGYSQMTGIRIDSRIRNDVNEKALFTDFKYYDNPEFFTKFMFAQEQFAGQASLAMHFFPNILRGLVTMGAMGAVIVLAGPVVLGVTAGFLVLTALVGLPTLKPEADFNVKRTDVWRPFDYVQRMLKQKENAAELRSSGAGLKFLLTVDTVLHNFRAVYLKYLKKVMPFWLIQNVITPIQNSAVLLFVILFVIDGDASKIGLYASLTAASAALTSNITTIYNSVNGLIQNTLYGERIAAFFEAESVIEPLPASAGKAAPPQGHYDIELRDVSFRYDNAAFGFEHLNLHIKPGQRVAIVGENGAGKTTLTKLLLRLYDVTGGALLVNGQDIRDYDVHALRLRMGVAFQDVRVLAMSLRDNLTVYHEADDARLLAVIEKLGLGGVLEKAGGDLDKMVSREFTEHGIVLSGGEAQRVTLARLFTGDFGLLVLDEPSSALDPLAEYKLMQTVLDAANTATTIMVAHRLSTVRDFDVIYQMEQGRIIESGTHEQLMAAQGKYFDMFTRQGENYQELAA